MPPEDEAFVSNAHCPPPPLIPRRRIFLDSTSFVCIRFTFTLSSAIYFFILYIYICMRFQMIAFVHPDAVPCSGIFRELGYEIQIRETPFQRRRHKGRVLTGAYIQVRLLRGAIISQVVLVQVGGLSDRGTPRPRLADIETVGRSVPRHARRRRKEETREEGTIGERRSWRRLRARACR